MAKRLRTLHNRKKNQRADRQTYRAVKRAVRKFGIDGAELFIDLIEADTPPEVLVKQVLPFALAERRRKAAHNG